MPKQAGPYTSHATAMTALARAIERFAQTDGDHTTVIPALTSDSHARDCLRGQQPDTCMLRRKLEDDPSRPKYIFTSRKAGYRLRQV